MESIFDFTARFLAKMKGDDATVSEINTRLACIADLELGIAKLNVTIISANTKLNNAIEALNDARINNGKTTVTEMSYCNLITDACNKVDEAEEELANHKEHLAFFEAELKNLKSIKTKVFKGKED